MGEKEPLKRRRPCDACRKRKSKCVIEENSKACVLCKFHQYDCTFLNPAQKKRKLVKPTIDQRGGIAIDMNSLKLDASLCPSVSNDRELDYHRTHSSEPKSAESSTGSTTSILDHANTTSGDEYQYGKTDDSVLSYIGASSEWDRSLISIFKPGKLLSIQSQYFSQEGIVKRELQKISSDESFIKLTEVTQNHLKVNSSEIEVLESIVESSGPRLILLYFRIVHPSFPIIDKSSFMAQVEQDIQKVPSCLLACLYLFALNWWSFDSDLSTENKPSQAKLEEAAERAFRAELDFPTISTVQAGLLLIQHQNFKNQYGNVSHVWVMQSSILAIAQELGLDQDCSSWSISRREKSLRKRLAWGLFIHEKWLSFSLGRTSHIQDDNWGIQKLEDCDFFAEDDNDVDDELNDFQDGIIDFELGKLLFIQMVELSLILSSVLKEIYGLSANSVMKSYSGEKVNEQLVRHLYLIKPLQQRLNEWESNLPDCLLMEDIKRGHISGTPNLHTAIFSVKIGLFRPILSYIVRLKTDDIEVDEEFLELLNIVIAKAYFDFESAIKFLSGMQAEHLQTFWYSFAKTSFAFTGTFGVLIALATSKGEQFVACLDKLSEYAWKLRINSKNAEFLYFSRVWIEQLKKLLPDHLTSNSFKPFRLCPQTFEAGRQSDINSNANNPTVSPQESISASFQHFSTQAFNLEQLLSVDYGLDW